MTTLAKDTKFMVTMKSLEHITALAQDTLFFLDHDITKVWHCAEPQYYWHKTMHCTEANCGVSGVDYVG